MDLKGIGCCGVAWIKPVWGRYQWDVPVCAVVFNDMIYL